MVPPHIVMFLVDDLGWQDHDVQRAFQHDPASAHFRTPNVQRLVDEGVWYTDAYAAAPVCTPTRVTWLTGRSPAATHVTWWTLRKDNGPLVSHPRLAPPDWQVNGLSGEEDTLPSLLGDAGYHTIHVGKAHFGADGTSGADPLQLGFDVNVAGHAAGAPGSYLGLEDFAKNGPTDGADAEPTIWDVPSLEPYHGEDVYLTEALAEEAVLALREGHATGKPVFLNFCPYAVHAPLTANTRYLPDYAELEAREAAYATMVASYDAALGVLLDELDALGIADETLVIFTSDNGGLSAHSRGGTPHGHNAPLRSGKGSAYEGGVRVPLAVAWPGRSAVGGSSLPVTTADLNATVLAAAGLEPTGEGLLLPPAPDVPPNKATPYERRILARPLVWHVPHQWGAPGPGIEPYSALRLGHWKLIWFHADGRRELYDLSRDLGESQDLASHALAMRDTLTRRLVTELKALDAQLPIDKATGLAIAWPD